MIYYTLDDYKNNIHKICMISYFHYEKLAKYSIMRLEKGGNT